MIFTLCVLTELKCEGSSSNPVSHVSHKHHQAEQRDSTEQRTSPEHEERRIK